MVAVTDVAIHESGQLQTGLRAAEESRAIIYQCHHRAHRSQPAVTLRDMRSSSSGRPGGKYYYATSLTS